MKKLLCTLLSLFFIVHSINSQVITNYYSQETDLVDELPIISLIKSDAINLQKVNFAKAIVSDDKKGRKIPRFAVKGEVFYSKENGDSFEVDDLIVWTMSFKSPSAASLTYSFSNVNLPKEAEMYIFSSKGNTIHGPITQKNIVEGRYNSVSIPSKQSTVMVVGKQYNFEELSLEINSISHGITNSGQRQWGDSSPCNVDIDCSTGNGWGDQSDAVARIVVNNIGSCTGALINNSCNDVTPLFLTAFHCIDIDNSGIISTSESNALGSWVFEFDYEATVASCPGSTSGSQSIQTISFSSADLRASNNPTDFALLEFDQSILNTPGLVLAGWNRSSSISTQTVTTIHHPAGDVKKISQDNEALVTTTANMWQIPRWDTGIVEMGSSGGPLFDSNKRIIGQLQGGDDNFGCSGGVNNVDNNTYGRFDLSWTGGGSNNTRLSNWLGTSGTPTTLNAIKVPYINYSGNEFVCSSNKTFTLVNQIPGRSTSWSVSPSNLVNVSSGSGSTATIKAKTSSTGGEATLTFTLTKTGCDPVVITEELYIGKPSLFSSSMNGQSPVSLVAIAAGSPTSYSWTKVTGSGNIYPNNNTCQAYNTSFMVVNASATNTCGTKSIKDFYLQSSSYSAFIDNNPTSDVFFLDISALLESKIEIKSIRVVGDNNRPIFTKRYLRSDGEKISFDLSNHLSGTYVVIIETDKGILTEKVIKI